MVFSQVLDVQVSVRLVLDLDAWLRVHCLRMKEENQLVNVDAVCRTSGGLN